MAYAHVVQLHGRVPRPRPNARLVAARAGVVIDSSASVKGQLRVNRSARVIVMLLFTRIMRTRLKRIIIIIIIMYRVNAAPRKTRKILRATR